MSMIDDLVLALGRIKDMAGLIESEFISEYPAMIKTDIEHIWRLADKALCDYDDSIKAAEKQQRQLDI